MTDTKKYFVYTHTTPDNWVYVGQTKNPKKRWEYDGLHYKDSILGDYIDEFGWDNITHTIVAEFDTREDALKKEDELIQYYREHNCCLNQCRSGLVSVNKEYQQAVAREQKRLWREEHRDEYNESQLKYNRHFISTPEGKVYNRVNAYNQAKGFIVLSPAEAKDNYLKYGIIPSFIKHNDINGIIQQYPPNQLSLFE